MKIEMTTNILPTMVNNITTKSGKVINHFSIVIPHRRLLSRCSNVVQLFDSDELLESELTVNDGVVKVAMSLIQGSMVVVKESVMPL